MGYVGEQKRQYQLEWITKRRNVWIESQGGCCAICKSQDRLEVDHINPETKLMQPAAIWSRKQEVRDEELAKCQVLCYDCHIAKTATELAVDHPHGSSGRYNKGCRCPECSKAGVDRVRAWRKLNMPV